MLTNKFNGTFPNFSMGFPFKFYYQFEVRCTENCLTLLHGGERGILADFLIIWLFVFLYFKIKNNKLTRKTQK